MPYLIDLERSLGGIRHIEYGNSALCCVLPMLVLYRDTVQTRVRAGIKSILVLFFSFVSLFVLFLFF